MNRTKLNFVNDGHHRRQLGCIVVGSNCQGWSWYNKCKKFHRLKHFLDKLEHTFGECLEKPLNLRPTAIGKIKIKSKYDHLILTRQ